MYFELCSAARARWTCTRSECCCGSSGRGRWGGASGGVEVCLPLGTLTALSQVPFDGWRALDIRDAVRVQRRAAMRGALVSVRCGLYVALHMHSSVSVHMLHACFECCMPLCRTVRVFWHVSQVYFVFVFVFCISGLVVVDLTPAIRICIPPSRGDARAGRPGRAPGRAASGHGPRDHGARRGAPCDVSLYFSILYFVFEDAWRDTVFACQCAAGRGVLVSCVTR